MLFYTSCVTKLLWEGAMNHGMWCTLYENSRIEPTKEKTVFFLLTCVEYDLDTERGKDDSFLDKIVYMTFFYKNKWYWSFKLIEYIDII